MNPFVYSTAAQRYARARPYYHPVVIDRIRETIPVEWPIGRAADVACGTGQSSVALKSLAQEIIGVDSSSEMLAEAPMGSGIRFIKAPAEDLPFPNDYFDIITVSSAFHWLNGDQFLMEARRVLRKPGWVVVYDNAFMAEMRGEPAFGQWFRQRYNARFPAPPRNWQPLQEDQAGRSGFLIECKESYSNDVVFALEGLVDYLLTQSNIIAAIEQGTQDIAAVTEWLTTSMKSFFSGNEASFAFGGSILYLRAIA